MIETFGLTVGLTKLTMAKFNYLEIHKAIAKSKIGEKRVRAKWENIVEANKSLLLKEFDEHPVTREILAGPAPTTENISGTLGGEGNLFSFLGFSFGDNPTGRVRDVLETQVRTATGVRREPKTDRVRFRFSLRIPTQEINAASPMNWESGKSWVNAIEKGVSGFSHYLWKKFIGPASYSLYGIQAKGTVRDGSFTKRDYLKEIFRNFVSRLTK